MQQMGGNVRLAGIALVVLISNKKIGGQGHQHRQPLSQRVQLLFSSGRGLEGSISEHTCWDLRWKGSGSSDYVIVEAKAKMPSRSRPWKY